MLITDVENNYEINKYRQDKYGYNYIDFNPVCVLLWKDKHTTVELEERYKGHISDYTTYKTGEKTGRLIEWFYTWTAT